MNGAILLPPGKALDGLQQLVLQPNLVENTHLKAVTRQRCLAAFDGLRLLSGQTINDDPANFVRPEVVE